jgi:hypothetical protein
VSMSEEQHVALPKLVGAPAYARPATAVAHTPRPFDPDDLPLEAHRTEDERELADTLDRSGGPVEPAPQPANDGRAWGFRALTGRILR